MDTYTMLLNLPRICFYIQIFNKNSSSPIYFLLYDPLIGIKNLKYILKYMTFHGLVVNEMAYHIVVKTILLCSMCRKAIKSWSQINSINKKCLGAKSFFLENYQILVIQ